MFTSISVWFYEKQLEVGGFRWIMDNSKVRVFALPLISYRVNCTNTTYLFYILLIYQWLEVNTFMASFGWSTYPEIQHYYLPCLPLSICMVHVIFSSDIKN